MTQKLKLLNTQEIKTYLAKGGIPVISVIIQKGTKFDRKYILSLARKYKNSNASRYVYIWNLVDGIINYPEQEGQIIYIGQSSAKKVFDRLTHEIAKENDKGNDQCSNYTLTLLYHKGVPLKLCVYFVTNNTSPEIVESSLHLWHIKRYGSLPIASGASTKNRSLTDIANTSSEFPITI